MKAAFKNMIEHNRRQVVTAAAAVFVAFALVMTGIFSYFESKDTVTNRLNAQNGSVAVREPKWENEGRSMAQAAEPGMQIPKDPYGVNNGETDVYIRLRMTVSLKDFDGEGKTDDYKANYRYTAAERLEPIVNAVKLVSGNTEEQFLTLDTSGGAVSEWKITNKNSSFWTDGDNHSGSDDKLVFYFYYKGGNTDGKLSVVKPQDMTAELFQRIDIPYYKKDYLGVFDQGFTVAIEAEGIPASYYPEGLDEADAPEKFE